MIRILRLCAQTPPFLFSISKNGTAKKKCHVTMIKTIETRDEKSCWRYLTYATHLHEYNILWLGQPLVGPLPSVSQISWNRIARIRVLWSMCISYKPLSEISKLRLLETIQPKAWLIFWEQGVDSARETNILLIGSIPDGPS